MLRDLSERRRTEEALRQSEKLNAVGQLAAGLAHEIRNPLTALKGFVQLLQQRADEKARGYLAVMQDELNRMELILSELLVLAKPQPVEIRRIRLQEALKDVIALTDSQLFMAGVQVQMEVDESAPPVSGDVNQLKQVFVNVIKNAIEAMPGGGRLTIRMWQEAGWVRIAFRDTGVGIPKDLQLRVGEPFFTTKSSGTGLGVMMSRRILEAHGGAFEMESEPGIGTTVQISVPIPAAAVTTPVDMFRDTECLLSGGTP
ncbi:ATP-binding protein [Alicyclobacillus sp.]|uniref:ATP-binding protein n=1 Tax=Alicyclobacillus sp. TaxID=61169 RepID=UPI0025C679F5|nr:ATP-binding protein [Alicyclobacillus sp.]